MIGATRKPAFTLLEVIISVAIFAVIVLAATQIFQSVLTSQVKNYTETALQDDIKYSLEVFTREVRGAIKNTTGAAICDNHIPDGQTYYTDGAALYFKNALGQCVTYYTLTDSDGTIRLVLDRGSESYYLSSERVDIETLGFVVADSATIQPLVTMNLSVKSEVNPNLPALNIQTSVSPNRLSN